MPGIILSYPVQEVTAEKVSQNQGTLYCTISSQSCILDPQRAHVLHLRSCVHTPVHELIGPDACIILLVSSDSSQSLHKSGHVK